MGTSKNKMLYIDEIISKLILGLEVAFMQVSYFQVVTSFTK